MKPFSSSTNSSIGRTFAAMAICDLTHQPLWGVASLLFPRLSTSQIFLLPSLAVSHRVVSFPLFIVHLNTLADSFCFNKVA